LASQINASNSGFGGIVSTGDSSGVLQLQTTGTTAVTIDTSQNVGIGTTSPTEKLQVVQPNGTNAYISTVSGLVNTYYGSSTGGFGNVGAMGTIGSYPQIFFTNSTERMRIASDGTVTITTGVSGTPAFAAYQSTGVALTAATFTKITFQTEEYDTNSNFASSRFTPTVAGYYQINGAWQFGSGGTVTNCAIYKNGTIYKQGTGVGGTAGYGGAVSSLVYFNGSSDYVELYGYASTAKTPLATIDATYFNGALVRGA
jgi:hypothetical protein